MPSRLWVLVIFVFWLGMVGLLYQRDLYPKLRTDEPPAFTLDLADEARIDLTERPPRSPMRAVFRDWVDKNVTSLRTTRWVQYKEDAEVCYTETRVVYQKRDQTLELAGELKRLPERPDDPQAGGRDPVLRIDSALSITWAGELRDVRADIWVRTPPDTDLIKIAQLDAPVREGRLTPHWRFVQGDEDFGAVGDPVPLSNRGGVLIAQQPVQRMTGLRTGQRWPVPVIDLLPLAERLPPRIVSAEAEVGEEAISWPVRHLIAGRRLPEPGMIRERGRVPPGGDDPATPPPPDVPPPRPERRNQVLCHVVTYRGDGQVLARTWARQSDGQVLQHEFTHDGEPVLLKR